MVIKLALHPRVAHKSTRHARSADQMGKLLLGCGIAASALYVAADIIGAVRYPGYNYVNQTVSELSATGAPTRAFTIATNGIVYGLLMTGFAVGVWRHAAPRRFARLTAGLLVGHVAIASVWWFYPMDRREVLAAGEETWRGSMHIPVGAANVVVLIIAILCGGTLLGRSFRTYSHGSVTAALLFGTLASLQAGQVAANEPTPLAGLQERVSVYAIVLWFGALAIGLLRAGVAHESGDQRHRQPGRDDRSRAQPDHDAQTPVVVGGAKPIRANHPERGNGIARRQTNERV